MTKARTYLKEWRNFRNLTQNQVVDRLTGFDDPQLPQTGASLSRLENGKQPYSQRVLEALSDIYDCEPHQLIGHNPYMAGEIVDLVGILDERAREKAMAYLAGLKAAQ